MEIAALGALPRFITALCEGAYCDRAAGKIEPTLESYSSLSPTIPFHIPSTDGWDPIELRDQELEIIAAACTYAASAVTAYATRLMSTARAHRNHMTPVYRIPDEVLSIIFEFTKSSLRNPVRSLSTKAPLNLSRVSRRWRKVALTNPMLWTAIDATNAPLAHLFIERSGSCLLDIELLSYDKSYYAFSDDSDTEDSDELDNALVAYDAHEDFLEPLLPHAERWNELSLEGLTYEDLGRLQLPHAPNLDCLRLFNIGDIPRLFATLPPHAPFEQRPPKLSILELNDFPLHFGSSLFTGLKELYLQDIIYPIGAPQHLLYVIAGCPFIEKIEFERVRLGVPHDVMPHVYPDGIRCSKLKSMALFFMEPDVVRSILSSMVIPPTARLAIWMNHRDNCLGEVLPPPALLARCLPNILAMRTLRLEIRPALHQIWLTGRASEGGSELLQLQFQCSSRARVTMSGPVEDVAQSFEWALPNLPVRTLSFLAVHDHQLGKHAFSKFVGSMPAITLLSLSECDAPMFLEMLIVAPTGHLCPLLEALHLQESYVRQSLLVDIINSRRPQMMHVQITRCSGIDEYTASELRSLAKIGWVK